jgi:acylphosphatase
MLDQRLQVLVSGRVQGVGFRYFSYMTGVNLNLTGWVRNRINGDVEILAEGPRSQLDLLLSIVSKGPDLAHVTEVVVEWGEPQGDLPPFTILDTR